MQTWKYYQILANHIQALKRCYTDDNISDSIIDGHWEMIEKLINLLPHGSGINYDYDIDALINDSIENRIVIYNRFDAMLESGSYDRVIDFKVVIKPSLLNTLDIRIYGKCGKYQDVKDYLIDLYYDAMMQEITQEDRIKFMKG